MLALKSCNRDLIITHCMKSVRIWSFSWPVFSGIQTEYREILCISLYSVQMRENTDQKNYLRSDFISNYATVCQYSE